MDYNNLAEGLTDYIDVEAGLARIMGNSKVYLRMLKIFTNTDEFDSFSESLEAGDYEKASEIAHTIKGMTGNLSFPKLFEISAALNIELKNGEKNDELVDKLFEAKEKTLEYIAILQEKLSGR